MSASRWGHDASGWVLLLKRRDQGDSQSFVI